MDFVSAPTAWLWIAAILVGEWGHFFAILCLLLFALSVWCGGRMPIVAAVLSFAAAIAFLTPAVRAAIIARSLQVRFDAAFAEAHLPTVAASPFSWRRLFCGTRLPPVDVTEYTYAPDGTKQLKLDVYQPHGRGVARPLVVIIHGGSWKGGDKSQLEPFTRYLAACGYAVASMNYRHAPKNRFPAAVDDVFSALEFLKMHATELQLDMTRVVLVGRSAGGQIALSAAYARRDPVICGVIAFYAPTDLVFGYEKPSRRGVLDSRRLLEDYLGGSPAQNPEVYAAASPLRSVRPATPPTLLIQGALDPIVSPHHSELLQQALNNAQRPHLYLVLPWATHGFDANLSGPSGQLSSYLSEKFLAAVCARHE
ncbi:MAG: alpha/beta hydrolase [Chthoniobacterales bacterium]|nr:alpha/beta hydrolase [Chthoniobacterales bacterium]